MTAQLAIRKPPQIEVSHSAESRPRKLTSHIRFAFVRRNQEIAIRRVFRETQGEIKHANIPD